MPHEETNRVRDPERLIFTGSGAGADFYGDVLFEDYNRAVVDVTKNAMHVRYLLTLERFAPQPVPRMLSLT